MVLVWLSTLVVFWGSILVAMFLMSLNPMAARHYRHMTKSSYIGIFGFFVLYTVVIIADGGCIPDQLMILWPVVSGFALCLTPFAMKSTEVDPVLDKLDGEEKQS